MRHRQEQLGERIMHQLSDVIRTRMQDPRIGFASVTGVQLSADLRHAKVFVSVMGSPEEQAGAMKALQHGTGFLRHELAQRLDIRYTPELAFKLDESIAQGTRILELLKQIKAEDEQALASSGAPPEGEA